MEPIKCYTQGCDNLAWVIAETKPRDLTTLKTSLRFRLYKKIFIWIPNVKRIYLANFKPKNKRILVKKKRVKHGEATARIPVCNDCYINRPYKSVVKELIIKKNGEWVQVIPQELIIQERKAKARENWFRNIT